MSIIPMEMIPFAGPLSLLMVLSGKGLCIENAWLNVWVCESVHGCFHTCTATLNLSRHYPEELHVRTLMSESVEPDMKQNLPCQLHSQSPCNVPLMIDLSRSLYGELTASEWMCWWHHMDYLLVYLSIYPSSNSAQFSSEYLQGNATVNLVFLF